MWLAAAADDDEGLAVAFKGNEYGLIRWSGCCGIWCWSRLSFMCEYRRRLFSWGEADDALCLPEPNGVQRLRFVGR